ncbi:MAG: serine hydrolase domain-containing protein [Solirubrobacteraceae bacterium]
MHTRSLAARMAFSKLRVATVAALALTGATAASVFSGPAIAAPSRQATQVEAFLADHWPHGASGTVLVARAGQEIACEGLGWADSAKHIRARCDTAYDIGSATKQFTAAAILKLQMMGRLRVSDPIDEFIDGVPPDKRTITISDLLTMTSGLLDTLGGDYQPLSREDMLDEAMHSRLLSPPGKAWHYSNVSYSILAAIIEKVSGMGYEPFLARYLFRPAGMRHTGYLLPHWQPGQVAVEYNSRGRAMGRPFDHPWAKNGPYWNLRGNGGIISTAPDMLRWDRALLHYTVLSRNAERELFAPRVRIDSAGDQYAYGWEILHSGLGPVAAHNGSNGWSFAVIARLLRQKVLVFWASNHAFQTGRWNLQQTQVNLTYGLLQAALSAGPSTGAPSGQPSARRAGLGGCPTPWRPAAASTYS